jgi:Zn-dependent protease with chaperone function
MFLTFFFVVISNKIVVSKTSISIENSEPFKSHTSEVYRVSQSVLDIDFGSNYYSKMLEADRFYKQGNLVKVKQIQREVKPDFPPAKAPPAAQADLSQLDAKGQKYWKTANQAIKEDPSEDDEVDSRIFEPLKSLVEEHPSFIPGHILLANTYDLYGDKENALSTIEKASSMYPGRDDVLDAKIKLLLEHDQPLEASIAAREFASSYPDYHKTPAYKQAADEYFKQYQGQLKTKTFITAGIGAGGQAGTGNESEAIDIGKMLLAGESTTGKSFSDDIKSGSAMVANTQQLKYVNDIGQKLAKLMGRDEFTYEFNIIEDPTPNAFALPGGKIFFHTGILQLMDSEAELAGVMAHEIAHSVLSHSYTKIAESATTDAVSNIGSGLLSNALGVDSDITDGAFNIGGVLLNKEFSRDKEEQADVLGLRVLDAAGYSADGLYNVMAKLNQLEGESNWAESLLSSHPASEERMRYLEELIQTRGYNRYGYEGVEAYRKVFRD